MKKISIPAALILSCASVMSHAASFDLNSLVTEYDNADTSSVSQSSNLLTLVGGANATAFISNVTSFDYVFSTTETMKVDEDIAGVFIGAVEIPLSSSLQVGADGSTGLQTYTFATPTSGRFDFFVADEVALKNPSELQISNIQTLPVSPVPEPETYALLAAGLAAMTLLTRRRQVAADAGSWLKGILKPPAEATRFS